MNETELQARLRRAKEELPRYVEAETRAREAYKVAMQDTEKARERLCALFLAEEKAEVARRRAEYRHSTL